jgi:hypothetical protein
VVAVPRGYSESVILRTGASCFLEVDKFWLACDWWLQGPASLIYVVAGHDTKEVADLPRVKQQQRAYIVDVIQTGLLCKR